MDHNLSLFKSFFHTLPNKALTKRLIALKIDPKLGPTNLQVARGVAWFHLVIWLQTIGETLPAAAMPQVVKVYLAWSMRTLGHDQLTPLLQRQLYYSLSKIETARETDWPRRSEPFDGELSRDDLHSLEIELRSGFLSFCNRTPELAAQYLNSLLMRPNNNAAVRSVLKMSGMLAQAAPKELAELTAKVFIREQNPEEQSQNYNFYGAFGFIDVEFYPPSPSQGPFLALLTYAPSYGLSLIRQLIDHAILFYSWGETSKNNKIIIHFREGERWSPSVGQLSSRIKL